jgi:hypothetical protein
VNNVRPVIMLVVGLCVAGGRVDARQMSTTERHRLVAHLEMTSGLFLGEIAGLTPAQLKFQPSPDAWSIAQVIDHLLVVGPIYWNDLQTAVKATAARRATTNTDADILWYGVDRTNREKAIPTELPMGRFRDLTSATAEYRKNYERLLQYIKTTADDLRAHHVPRQGSDAYQWALLISTHEQRHVLQIREIKTAKNFPGRVP